MYAPSINVLNGHNSSTNRPALPALPRETITVVGIPSVAIQHNRLVVGSSQSSSVRSYTPLKVLGDGSFGTVLLCDWHGTLPPNTPLSPMQCGAGARLEWTGKRLVAVKRMRKRWEGGWDECQKLKELESLRAIPFHPNIIPLYDFFLLPATKELYFVFESMEGNLYHLIKTRKGKAFAGGLVSSIFHQIVSGLDHIHSSGYFHRDMKPENVLVTTTGLFDYTSVSPVAPLNAPKERDVVAIIKLADFGLARETNSSPPYTEYVSTRWYRAPEVLLLSRDYSNPVDMWALGTIMAELVNLRPLFPGSDQVDQIARICEILGDPSDAYGVDSQSNVIGGGSWSKGIRLAEAVGFRFPKIEPKNFFSLFERGVPLSLIQCIRDLLKYDPRKRLTSRQCLHHSYLQETTPRNNIPIPADLRTPTKQMNPSPIKSPNSTPAMLSSRTISQPPSHNSVNQTPTPFPDVSSSLRTTFHPPGAVSHSLSPVPQGDRRTQQPSWAQTNGINHVDDPMDVSPSSHDQLENFIPNVTTDIHGSPMVQEYPARPQVEPDPVQDTLNSHLVASPPTQGSKLVKLGALSFNKKYRWNLGMFGGDKSHHQPLPPVAEIPGASTSTTSLKRTQSSSTDSKSLRDSSPVRDNAAKNDGDVKKNNKKEAERLQREAEKQRRKLAEKMNREQARAVMQKRSQMMQKTVDIEWLAGPEQRVDVLESKGKQSASGPIRQNKSSNGNVTNTTTLNAAAGRYVEPLPVNDREWRGTNERFAKARRREFDDDHSMSSSEVQSLSRMSSMSFATVDSDPGPSRLRNHPSLFNISRMTSMSSLRTSFDEFSTSGRSSNSFSLEGQLAHDFRTQASVNSNHLVGSLSPPPMQMLSLSPTISPSLSPSPHWIKVRQPDDDRGGQSPPFISISSPHQMSPIGPHSPLDLHGQLVLPSSPYHPSSPYGNPPSSGNTPKSSKSAINPIFQVVSYKWDSTAGLGPDDSSDFVQPSKPPLSSPNALPPFAQLEAVAGGEYPPLSPMSFTSPEDS